MSSTYISADLRRLVTARAGNSCEYCRIHLVGSVLEARTAVGEVTARILQFNTPERSLERQALIEVGRYSVAVEPD